MPDAGGGEAQGSSFCFLGGAPPLCANFEINKTKIRIHGILMNE